MRNEEGKERGMVEKERGKAENRKEMMEKEKGDGGRRWLEKQQHSPHGCDVLVLHARHEGLSLRDLM